MYLPEPAAIIVGIMGLFLAFWAVQRLLVCGWGSLLAVVAGEAMVGLLILALAIIALEPGDPAQLNLARALVAILLPAFLLNLVSGLAILGIKTGSPAAAV